MALVEELASFALKTAYEGLSQEARDSLKVRVLDSLACAIGAVGGEPVRLVREQVEEFGGKGPCTLIGGGKAPPDRAALYNSFLIRYLDFNDSYLAQGETCHPSDNLGAVLAAAEYARNSGKELLAALALAYQVQCRLSDVAPVRSRGFDHTTQGCFALAAGVSRALGLDREKTAHALAISGTAFNALRVTRTGSLSHWKGLAYPNASFCCTHATFLAKRGITGPREVFEGNKGFMDSISGRFSIDWQREDLERVRLTIIKKFNAEVHSQSAIEGILELKAEHGFAAGDVSKVEIEIFDVAFHIIGGGEEGDKTQIREKEEADHSLPYMAAAALLDGQLMPEQYVPERIRRHDVQDLLKRVFVRPRESYSQNFPRKMPCLVRVRLKGGRVLVKEKKDYEGFHTRPARWESVKEKFDLLAHPYADSTLRREIVDAASHLESVEVGDLMQLLARVRGG